MNYKKIATLLYLSTIYFQAFATTDNIAVNAKVTASTTLNEKCIASNIRNGIIGLNGKGEWACEGITTDWGYVRFPWIQLDWKQLQPVNKVVLYDRSALDEHIAGGKLLFSDSSIIWVNKIPNDGTAKAIKFQTKNITWVRFSTTDGDGKDLGFSEIEVYNANSKSSDYVSWVDPYIETNRGRYFFFITGNRPFGMVGAALHTRNKNQNGGGYNYNENEILGFGQIHCWMLSGIEVMPALSTVDPRLGESGWKSTFSHDDEIVQPGYQRVYLRDPKTWVELTSTERVSFYRFRYPQDMSANILVNLGGYMGNSIMANAEVTKISNSEFEGSFSSIKRYWGGPKDVKVFFLIQFNKAPVNNQSLVNE